MAVTPRTWISYGKAKVLLSEMIIAGSHSPVILDLAADLAREHAPMDKAAQSQALWAYVKGTIFYLEDPYTDDHFQSPEVTIKRGAGDCDDQAILLGALLRSIGIQTRLVFVFDSPPTGDAMEFPAHVYLEGNVGRSHGEQIWAAMETIPVPGPGGGFYYPQYGQQQPGGFRERLNVE
jgi:transglutaminase-like putative cysteine protease